MTDSFVQVAPDSTGKKIDNVQLAQTGGDTVQRQVVTIGDATNVNNRAVVDGSGALKVAINAASPLPAITALSSTPQLSSTPINLTDSGNIVPPISGRKITVHRLFLVVDGATTLKFRDGSNDLTGPMTINPGDGVTLDMNGEPWFQTTVGQAFAIVLGNAVQVSGRVYYALD